MTNVFSIEDRRAVSIIRKTAEKLQLDLTGLNVLTEAGSNVFAYTPTIPLLAGASKVFAYCRDSKYGSVSDILTQTRSIALALGLADRLHIVTDENLDQALLEADIVTNSGMLRPLDVRKIGLMKPTAVIPLMYEKWELRENDIDIKFCKQQGIKVAGTWESNPSASVFGYVGMLAVKMMLEAGCSVFEDNVFIWSNDEFGRTIKNQLDKTGVASCMLSNDKNVLLEQLENVDAVFICDYHEERCYVGNEGVLDIPSLFKLNPLLKIVHLYGDIPIDAISKEYHKNIYPARSGYAQQMSFTLQHVGIRPVLNLLVAGFKVGEELFHNRCSNLSQIIV